MSAPHDLGVLEASTPSWPFARRVVTRGHAQIVQDIRSIIVINRAEKVSVLLVEQDSRMALRMSNRAYGLTAGSIALSSASADLAKDQRTLQLCLGDDI